MKTIHIIAEDKVGLLADISYILGKSRVNIDSLHVDVIAKKSIITLLVKDREKAKEVLEAAGYKITEENTVVIKLKDEPGQLSKITNILAQDGVNINNVSMLSRDGTDTILAVSVDKVKKAETTLSEWIVKTEN